MFGKFHVRRDYPKLRANICKRLGITTRTQGKEERKKKAWWAALMSMTQTRTFYFHDSVYGSSEPLKTAVRGEPIVNVKNKLYTTTYYVNLN